MKFQQLIFFGDDDISKTATERYLSVGRGKLAQASMPAPWCVPFDGRLSNLLVHQQGAEENEGNTEATQIRYSVCLLDGEGAPLASELEAATIATNTGPCQDYEHIVEVLPGALVVFRCTKTGPLATPLRDVVGTVLYTVSIPKSRP